MTFINMLGGLYYFNELYVILEDLMKCVLIDKIVFNVLKVKYISTFEGESSK